MGKISNELFRFANNRRCKEYYLDVVNGISYIRPITSKLYKRVDERKAKAIYKRMIDYGKKYKYPYDRADISYIFKEFKRLVSEYNDKELEHILKNKEDVLNRYFSFLNNNELNDIINDFINYECSMAETDEFDDFVDNGRQNKNEQILLLIQKMKSQHHLSKTMNLFWEYILIMDLPLELSMSRFYNEVHFEEYDFNEAFISISEIGYMIQDKNLKDILNYDCWDSVEKKRIEDKVLDFAKSFGLLGILSKIFSFDENGETMYYSHRDEPNKISVNTILMDAFYCVCRDKLLAASTLGELLTKESAISLTMNVINYIKVFFPEDEDVYYEAYQLQDERYWNVYSEPIYVFLLGVKIFHEEYFRYQKNHNNPEYGNNNSTEKQLPIISKVNFSYDTVIDGYIMEYKFRTLLEGIIFYAKKQLIHSSNTTIFCEVCGKPVSGKNPKKKPKYCSKSCRESVSSNKYYKNNQEAIKEKKKRKATKKTVAKETMERISEE